MLRRITLFSAVLFGWAALGRADEPNEKPKPEAIEAAKKAFEAIGSPFLGKAYSPTGQDYFLFGLPIKGTDEFLKKVPDVPIPFGFDTFAPLTEKAWAELPRLKNLAYLGFLRQPVGVAGMKSLAECPGLRCLVLSGANGVTDEGIAILSKSKSIRDLRLDGVGLPGKAQSGSTITEKALVDLAKMTQLEHLSLARALVTDESMKPLKTLVKMKSLNFFEPKQFTAAGLEVFREGKSLESIVIFNGQADDAFLKELAHHPNMKHLSMNTFHITNAGLKEIRFLTKMEELSLTFSKITDEGLTHLAGMTKLKMLDLTATKITDAAIADLRWFKDLETLSVIGTQVTKEGLEKLKKALPKCRVRYNSTDF